MAATAWSGSPAAACGRRDAGRIYPEGTGPNQIQETQPAAPDLPSVAGRGSFGTYHWMGPGGVTAVRAVELEADAGGPDGAAEVMAAQVDSRSTRQRR